MTKQKKNSKEMQDILDAVAKYIDKNNREVCIIASVCNFDKKGDVDELMWIGYGDKKTVKVCLSEMRKSVDKEGNFVNW